MRRRKVTPVSSEWAFMGASEVVRGFTWLVRVTIVLAAVLMVALCVIAWLLVTR